MSVLFACIISALQLVHVKMSLFSNVWNYFHSGNN
jgi:hypothetical protein